jgi:hypothetical protein
MPEINVLFAAAGEVLVQVDEICNRFTTGSLRNVNDSAAIRTRLKTTRLTYRLQGVSASR